MMPFRILESDSFKNFIHTINKDVYIPSRKNFVTTIKRDAILLERRMTKFFETLTYVATTADAWSAHHRSFIGVTIHWIDRQTLQRRHGVLGCSMVTEAQTHTLIHTVLLDIYNRYNILHKVVSTTTDNGRNFLKAFQVFGEKNEDDHLVPFEDDSDEDEDEDEDEVTPVPIADVFDGEELEDLTHLPPHRRCVVHTLNLLATADLKDVPGWSSSPPKPIFKKVQQKCVALWNKQNRKTTVAATIKKELGKLFTTPSVTRWNSQFDAIKQVSEALEKKIHKVNKICMDSKISPFTNIDNEILKEYILVMSPIAISLDFLQAEDKAYFGVLLPTLYFIKKELTDIKEQGTLKYANSLMDYILDSPSSTPTRPKGFHGRFGDLFMDKNLLAATALHPHYK